MIEHINCIELFMIGLFSPEVKSPPDRLGLSHKTSGRLIQFILALNMIVIDLRISHQSIQSGRRPLAN